MALESDLYTRLSGYAGLIALTSTRIYPLQAPEDVASPYCVYMTVSRARQYSHDGYGNLDRCRVQVSCYGTTYASAHAVAAQVTAAMEAWPASNTKVQSCLHDGEQDFFEEETETYHVPIDFIVWYG